MSSLTLAAFFGWCAAINIGLLVVASIFLTLVRGPIARIHGRMFGLDEVDLSRQYLQYLGQYKIAILVLNLIPYIVLKIMA